MDLKTNMYVRTKDGKIAKFIKYDEEDKEELVTDYYEYSTIWIKDVTKASHNIIEILEEKDLVEIEYYSPRYKERITRLFEVDFKHKDNITFGNTHCQLNIFDGEWGNHDQLLEPVIKSIVTREQFEQMQYKVGE